MGSPETSDPPHVLPHAAYLPEQEQAGVKLLLELGGALHNAGVPAHRLEDLMARVAARVGLEVRTFSTPTSLFVSWGPPEAAKTAFIRVEPGVLDLGKLSEIDALTAAYVEGRISSDEAHDRLESLSKRPQHYPVGVTTLAYFVASAAGARLFGGGLAEVVAAGTIGLLTGLLVSASATVPALGRVLEGLAAAIAALVATVGARLYPLSTEVTILAGLYILLPGLTFTTAINELATQNLISGTARMASAFVTLFQLLVGVAFGTKLATYLEHAPIPTLGIVSYPLPTWSVALAIALGSTALLVLFRARKRDVWWVLAASVVAYTSAKFGTRWLGPQLGAFLGALAVGAGSNLAARWADRPAVITIVPGLMMLVPGSLGFRSLDSLLMGDVVTGIERAFGMAFTGFALVAGLLVANVLVAPKRSL